MLFKSIITISKKINITSNKKTNIELNNNHSIENTNNIITLKSTSSYFTRPNFINY
ncbi:hypothetical protein DDB_G0276621 [Dictyostelium discoideum AX4]|uniref:Uncharacterized protein n=1 Tax=Dictyostelium discoideum TaxID=44689 RepID=Q551D2_DICDI|nr:hypothetical protein DDB_G0276621 [Dictyostelium discoideum AX4]EAL69123.1 hypothetical protein DDB_G0276621 [Dictyostelium discoideum AX4]|eukprot:XP_643061.1 hypothetical protein DDB_G0276621 [Dictyostelium discoideum AX4]